MQQKNRYIRGSRISEEKFLQLVKGYVREMSAVELTRMTRLNRNTVNRYLLLLRKRLARLCEEHSPVHTIRHDTSRRALMLPVRVPDEGKSCIPCGFGVIQFNGSVYTELIPRRYRQYAFDVMQNTCHCNVPDDLILQWQVYDGIVDLYSGRLLQRYANSPVNSKNLKNFWSYARNRLRKFFGIPASTFYFHLKESEFRYNHQGNNLFSLLLENLRQIPLN